MNTLRYTREREHCSIKTQMQNQTQEYDTFLLILNLVEMYKIFTVYSRKLITCKGR